MLSSDKDEWLTHLPDGIIYGFFYNMLVRITLPIWNSTLISKWVTVVLLLTTLDELINLKICALICCRV